MTYRWAEWWPLMVRMCFIDENCMHLLFEAVLNHYVIGNNGIIMLLLHHRPMYCVHFIVQTNNF